MKKSYIYVVVTFITLLLSACGSNDKSDGNRGNPSGPNGTNSKITVKLQDGVTIDKESGAFNAAVTFSSTYDKDVEVKLGAMDLELGGCKIKSDSVTTSPPIIVLTGENATRTILATAMLEDPACIPTSLAVKGLSNVVINGELTEETFATNSYTIGRLDIKDPTMILNIIDPITKVLEINASNLQKFITLSLTKGSKKISSKNIVIAQNATEGSFLNTLVSTDAEGKVSFAYTAPTFTKNKSMDVRFCMQENNSICDVLKINLRKNTTSTPPDTGNDVIDYGITFVNSDGDINRLGLDEKKLFRISLINKDTNKAINAQQIQSIMVESNKPNILKVLDPSDAAGNAVSSVTLTGQNPVDIFLKSSKKIPGLSDIKITIHYKNSKGNDRVLIKTYAITVLSGPPTAFSITSAGVKYNKSTKWFEHTFLVSATDKYSNKINTSPTISVGVMSGYAKDSNGDRIIYGRAAKTAGISVNLTAGSPVLLDIVGKAPLSDFDSNTLRGIDKDRDMVALFGNIRTYEANGKWEIDDLLSASQLSVVDEYQGESYTGLGIAIGHNYREDKCDDSYAEYHVKVNSSDGLYKLDEEGKALVVVRFPARYMVGKQVAIMVNLVGQNPETGKQLRSGEVHFVTLHSFQGIKGKSFPVKAGETKTVRLYGEVDTGTEDKFWLQNSTFRCSAADSSNISFSNFARNNPDDCVVPYIEYTVTTTDNSQDGSLVLNRCQVNTEFSF